MEDEHDDEGELGANDLRGLTKPIFVALLAAVAFVAGTVGYFVALPDSPGASSVEVGFYQDMTSHHEQAIEMALIELTNGSEKDVLDFAREVVIFQRYEIGRMADSLIRWNAGHERPPLAMTWMGHKNLRVENMPGLATESEMDQLRAAKGRAADALFLRLMAEHHRGGIHMARYAARHTDDSVVRDVADVMVRNQTAEINEYRTFANRLQLGVDIAPA